MKWPFIDGHCIPPEEMNQHEARVYCSCSPQIIYDAEGVIWYRHNRFDNTLELLEAAENLKAAESVKLHMNAELKGLKMQVYPYGMPKIFLLKSSNRKENEQ